MIFKIVAAGLGATAASELMTAVDYKFIEFVSQYGKSYGTKAEFEFRSKIFAQNYAEIEALNAKQNTARYGVNFISDMTNEEKKKLTGLRLPQRKAQTLSETQTPKKTSNSTNIDQRYNEETTVFDWKAQGKVTPVKNQGMCGSCWAFSAVGAVESAWAISQNLSEDDLVKFSEQQVVDCDLIDGGCNGGFMDTAFDYMRQDDHTLLKEEDYRPYSEDEQACTADYSEGLLKTVDIISVAENDQEDFIAKLHQNPLSVAVEAGQTAFTAYSSGVVTTDCDSVLDHGIVAVGYGTLSVEGGDDITYAICKNSWGDRWGEQGYIKIALNQCGVNDFASYATVVPA